MLHAGMKTGRRGENAAAMLAGILDVPSVVGCVLVSWCSSSLGSQLNGVLQAGCPGWVVYRGVVGVRRRVGVVAEARCVGWIHVPGMSQGAPVASDAFKLGGRVLKVHLLGNGRARAGWVAVADRPGV